MDPETIETIKGVGAVGAGFFLLGSSAFFGKMFLATCLCDKRDYESNRFRYVDKGFSTRCIPMYEGDPRVYGNQLSERAVESVFTLKRGRSLVEEEREIISNLPLEERKRVPVKLYDILGLDRKSLQERQ